MHNRLKRLSDESLIEMIHSSSDSIEQMYATDLLMERYKELVRSKARTYFLIGADRDDVVQEGMIGLYKAIKDFKPEKDSSFRTFAQLCIVRQILSAIRVSSRLKHLPLNEYISLNRSVNDEDGKETTMIDLLPDPNSLTPEEILTGLEERRRLDAQIDALLSPMEKRVLQLFLEGLDYTQIAERMDKKTKSVDNALQRVKQKISQMLQE